MNRTLLAASLSAALITAGCTPKPARLEVEPRSLKFTASGDVVILLPSVLDEKGEPAKHKGCVFVSSDPAVADVKLDGTVTANSSGSAEIRVSCEELVKAVPVTVSLPSIVALTADCSGRCFEASADPLSLKLEGFGATAQVHARVLDKMGQQVPVEVRYEITDPEFNAGARKLGVEVSKEGLLTAVAVGKFMLIAQAGTAVGKANLEVVLPIVDVVQAPRSLRLKPGATAQLEVTTLRRTAQKGLEPVAGARLGYQCDSPDVLTVDDDGKLTAVAEGTADVIVAADSGAFAQVEVIVSSQDEPPPAPPRAIKRAKFSPRAKKTRR